MGPIHGEGNFQVSSLWRLRSKRAISFFLFQKVKEEESIVFVEQQQQQFVLLFVVFILVEFVIVVRFGGRRVSEKEARTKVEIERGMQMMIHEF